MGLVRVTHSISRCFNSKTPISYKVPKTGYHKALDELLRQIDTTRALGLSEWEFTKNNIIVLYTNLYNR
jgi:hypothetical protein